VRLLTAHKVLIGAAIALGLLLVPWGIIHYRRDHDVTSLVLAVAGGVVAVSLSIYLRTVLKKYGGKLG
jgi:uncharacterized membrane protein (UPF0136 family)